MIRLIAALAVLVWLLLIPVTGLAWAASKVLDAVYPAAQLVYISTRDRLHGPELYLLDVTHRLTLRLTRNQLIETAVIWSPDGTQIVFGLTFEAITSLYQLDLFSLTTTRLTDGTFNDMMPAWSPDGSRLVFVSNRAGIADLYQLDVDTGAVALIDNHPARDLYPVWSPDGSQLAFLSNRDRGYDAPDLSLHLLDVASGRLRVLDDSASITRPPTWSPDGRWLAYAASRAGQAGQAANHADIFLYALQTGQRVNLTRSPDEESSPVWSPAGDLLALVIQENNQLDLALLPVAQDAGQVTVSGPLRRLTNDPTHEYAPAWRP